MREAENLIHSRDLDSRDRGTGAISFPLAPGEREFGIQSVREVNAHGQHGNSLQLGATLSAVLPLPEGEGRGEGNGGVPRPLRAIVARPMP